ncbi:hypothetical protein PIIN_09264 [Serendipita indica DSM 11827]|uniref:Uncharacterized protein n=1 Tax=Serendipita indica (strain DSM 11827) TaxID=1109443 RepID=G4TVD7_SERID|nr:hypothetical protein PIIN_09264 [Serendipita indica DSM 11827]
MPSFQGPLQELFQRASARLSRATVKSRDQAGLLIERAKILVLGSANPPIAASSQAIYDPAAQSAINLLNTTADSMENSVPLDVPSNPRMIADVFTQQTRILDSAHENMRGKMPPGTKDATVLKQQEAESKEHDEQRSLQALQQVSQSSVVRSTAVSQAVAFELLDMDNHDEKNVIKLERDVFPSGIAIRRRLVELYDEKFPDRYFAFKLWYELPKSPCGVSRRFWQIGEQCGEVPTEHSRLYFVNVALPSGPPGTRQYTVVTVCLDEHEEPFPVGESLASCGLSMSD